MVFIGWLVGWIRVHNESVHFHVFKIADIIIIAIITCLVWSAKRRHVLRMVQCWT